MSEFHPFAFKCVLVSLLFMRSSAISVCSEGLILGRPSAKIALYPPISGISCEQLEHDISLGHLPLLSQEQQPFIDAACECRPPHQKSDSMDTDRMFLSPTAMGQFPTAPVHSYPSAFLSPSYAPVSFSYPFESSSSSNSNNENNTKQDILNALPFVIPVVLIILLFVCVFMNCKFASETPNIQPSDDTIRQEPKESEEAKKERRRLVIELLFPVQDNNCTKREEANGENAPSRRFLKHDTESKSSKSLNDLESETQCSICLEDVVEDVIFGKCTHRYHRSCIMKWMHDGHDECPNCRQLMWDRETYEYVEKCVQEREISETNV